MTSSRLQLALNVSDLGVAVERYTAVFGQGPSKERPGYASFVLSEPPLKLVLFENPHATSARRARSGHAGECPVPPARRCDRPAVTPVRR